MRCVTSSTRSSDPSINPPREGAVGNIDAGLSAWRMASNHNRMIALQQANPAPVPGPVELAYFGSSAFRITSPGGLSVMVDPWRNFPTRKWDWYFHDFPITAVDIGVSTHAHFDHDALHRLDAHVLLDRLIGTYRLGDVKLTGIADKHATDSSAAVYDFKRIIRHFDGIDIEPPNNPRSWDHCLILIETGGEALGQIDILLLPVDDSQHVMSFPHAESIIERLQPRVVVPHHYYIFDVTVRQSTLQPADPWVTQQGKNARWLDSPTVSYRCEEIAGLQARVDFFGDHVAFDTAHWHKEGT